MTKPIKYLAHSHIGWCILRVKNDHKMASVPSSDNDGSIFLLESVIRGHHRMALELVHLKTCSHHKKKLDRTFDT